MVELFCNLYNLKEVLHMADAKNKDKIEREKCISEINTFTLISKCKTEQKPKPSPNPFKEDKKENKR